jgi:import inner membrane translocase subunit TIM13
VCAAQINMEQQQVFLQQLMNKLREECFTRCITSPGRELSSRDQSCLNNCVDRYLGESECLSTGAGTAARRSHAAVRRSRCAPLTTAAQRG